MATLQSAAPLLPSRCGFTLLAPRPGTSWRLPAAWVLGNRGFLHRCYRRQTREGFFSFCIMAQFGGQKNPPWATQFTATAVSQPAALGVQQPSLLG
ncbi:cell division cycle and apoptosis regulator 1, partial [Homo sapiens]